MPETTADPARDGPACPACKLEGMGTPISDETMIDRWDGPADANLSCPACGAGWVGTAEDVARAWASWRAYVAEMLSSSAERETVMTPPISAKGYRKL